MNDHHAPAIFVIHFHSLINTLYIYYANNNFILNLHNLFVIYSIDTLEKSNKFVRTTSIMLEYKQLITIFYK